MQSIPVFLALGLANGGSLYFIPILISLYLIYPILLRLQKMIGWTNLLLLSLCFSAISEYANLQYNAALWNANPVSLAFFGRLLFVFTAGMALSKIDSNKMAGWLPASIALSVLFSLAILSRSAGLYVLAYLFAPVAFSCLLLNMHRIAMKTMPALARLFEELGRNTLIMYMMQSTVLFFILKPLIQENVPTWISFIVLVLLTTVISYASSLIFTRAYRSILMIIGVSRQCDR
ncbi:acyltransferase family protein [Candidatus Micrarchaeota archaeon]|nr:acyltransferase family protein [Candidatus Micrarchaeota archaeon]